ncbi:MAG: MoaD/ThiS family protein [Micrococcaceae bacterium]
MPTMTTIQLTVRYFAAAAEAAGVTEEQLRLAEPTLASLRAELTQRYGAPMAKVLRSGSFLVDGVVRRDGGALTAPASGALTVDVLPPFAGG